MVSLIRGLVAAGRLEDRSMNVRHLLLAGLAWSAALGPARADELQLLRSRGAEVYFLDMDLRGAFGKANPKVLPEAKRKLPPATVAAFDWSTKVTMPHWLAQAKSQYCWAFATVTAFEWSWAIRNGGAAPALAIQPIIDRTKSKGGAPPQLALEELLAHGTCAPRTYPHKGWPGKVRPVPMTHRAIAWGEVSPGAMPRAAQIKQALLNHGPLVASVFTTPFFDAYKGGVFNEHFQPPKDGPKSNHTVVIVGWNDRMGRKGCWKIQNSWGPWWGLAGFMWIEYGSNNIGHQACWIRPQSVHYHLPENVHEQITGGADPFPRWPEAKEIALGVPNLPVATPAEALKMAGQRLVLQFEAKSWGLLNPAGDVQLLSTRTLKDDQCVIVRLLQPELRKFPAQEGKALFGHYRGKRLRVRGFLQPFTMTVGGTPTTRLVMEVGDPRQIEMVEGK
jgi:hypothetical protein